MEHIWDVGDFECVLYEKLPLMVCVGPEARCDWTCRRASYIVERARTTGIEGPKSVKFRVMGVPGIG